MTTNFSISAKKTNNKHILIISSLLKYVFTFLLEKRCNEIAEIVTEPKIIECIPNTIEHVRNILNNLKLSPPLEINFYVALQTSC